MSREPLRQAGRINPPTPLARRFVRAVVGFGVGIAVGCAPLLGAIDVPLFSSLLSLFPIDLRTTILPLGGFLVGIVAAGTQFYSGVSLPTNRIRLLAKKSLLVTVAALPLLLISYLLLVRQVHYRDNFVVSVVTGLVRSSTCSCPPATTDSMCLKTLSANPDNVELCWGRLQVRLSEFMLSIVYLVLIGSFSFFIGMLLIQEDKKREATAIARKKKR